jgi:hypothetical protein
MTEAAPSFPDSAFPSEPFPCPACGQMLASACRVCVACKQPIDPAKIRAARVDEPLSSGVEAQAGSPVVATVRFPWPLFFAIFFARILAAGLIDQRWGFLRAELVLGGLEVACAVWVFYDAGRHSVPRPFRWAWGTLLLWPLVFPWYLARRRTPRALCPFVEGSALPIVLVMLVALGILAVLLKGPIK